eukprot:jgi/Tetstr1/428570/TSEL_018564.t1
MRHATAFQVRASGQCGQARVDHLSSGVGRVLRTPGTIRRRLLWTELALLIALEVSSWTIVAVSPLSLEELQAAVGDRQSGWFLAIDILNNVKLFSCYGVAAWIFMAHCFQSAIVWNDRWFPSNSAHLTHWTLAASSGVFRETAHTVMRAQTLTLLLMAIILVVCLVPIIVNTVNDVLLRTPNGRRDWEAGIAATCGPGITMCSVSWYSRSAVIWPTACMMVTLASFFVSTPARLWSPVSKLAVTKIRHTRLWRMLWLPVIGVPMATWMLLALCFGTLIVTERTIGTVEPVFERRFSTYPADQSARAQRPVAPARWWQSPAFLLWLQELRIEPGVRYMQSTVLLLDIFLWGTNIVLWLQNIPAIVMVCGCRVWLLAVLLLGSGEQPADFNLLQQHGSGFGLVVGAKELADALERAADGRRLPDKLPQYKASALRMQETLAVSYRWQAEKVKLAEGAWVNMTVWQMRTLAETIRSSTALYVWLDHLSVPQQSHRVLMKRLLTRMMAVYATAGITLSLRSCEQEGSRYHQRGWTAQEFCTAPQMIVITEDSPGDSELAACAYLQEEESVVRGVRRWWQSQARRCMPFWLCEGANDMTAEQLQKAMEKYEEVEARVHTEDPVDMLRALYPLMFHSPVENQDELVKLVTHVNQRLGRVEPKLKSLKWEMSSHSSLWRPTVEGDSDDAVEPASHAPIPPAFDVASSNSFEDLQRQPSVDEPLLPGRISCPETSQLGHQ